MKKLHFLIFTVVASAIFLTGCQSMYYGAMEKIGFQKREIFVDRVQRARKTQARARDQFQDALERFGEVVDYKGGKLEKRYEKLDKAFARCKDRAKDVRDEINDVASVANALFKEWRKELGQYNDKDLKEASEAQLQDTREKYDRMIASMRRAEKSMEPVLQTLNDQVLFLKHNLNAQAIASIQLEADNVSREVSELIREMERSIAEADRFIREMGVN